MGMRSADDLNKLYPEVDGCGWQSADGAVVWDYRRTRHAVSEGLTAHFGDLTDSVCSFIDGAELIVGCVAWLTSDRILEAMSQVDGVAVIVQKEDFLRPDTNASDGWEARLRANYARLPSGPCRLSYGQPLCSASTCCDPMISPVRCVGQHNKAQRSATPRAHHKFILRCAATHCPDSYCGFETVVPLRLWTGSFNFSANAGRSLENAITTADPAICDAYLAEFCRVAVLSEPLDWNTDWAAPEWRIGT